MLKAALRSGFTSSGLEEDEAREEESTAVCSQSHSDLTQVPSPYLVPVPEWILSTCSSSATSHQIRPSLPAAYCRNPGGTRVFPAIRQQLSSSCRRSVTVARSMWKPALSNTCQILMRKSQVETTGACVSCVWAQEIQQDEGNRCMAGSCGRSSSTSSLMMAEESSPTNQTHINSQWLTSQKELN